MTHPQTFAPPPELAEYVASYGILEIPEGVSEPFFSPPLGLSGFIIQLENISEIAAAMIDGSEFFTDNEVATGQVTSPVYGELPGKRKTLMVFFQPTGMHGLFGNNMSRLTNKAVSLYDFLEESEAGDLLSALRGLQDKYAQVDTLNRFFLAKVPSAHDTKAIRSILDSIHEKNGNLAVEEIVRAHKIQRKTLERRFQQMVGLSPKVYAQIYRFKRLMNFLQENPGTTWAQLSTQAGYYDQSHMIRYFKEYLNVSPNNTVRLDLDFINYLLKQ